MTVILIIVALVFIVLFAIKLMQSQAAEEVHALGGLRNIFKTFDNVLLESGFKVQENQLRKLSYSKKIDNKICELEITKNVNLNEPYWFRSYLKTNGNTIVKSLPFIIDPNLTSERCKEALKMQLLSIGVNIDSVKSINRIGQKDLLSYSTKQQPHGRNDNNLDDEVKLFKNIPAIIIKALNFIDYGTEEDLNTALQLINKIRLYNKYIDRKKHQNELFEVELILYIKMNNYEKIECIVKENLSSDRTIEWCKLSYILTEESNLVKALNILENFGMYDFAYRLLENITNYFLYDIDLNAVEENKSTIIASNLLAYYAINLNDHENALFYFSHSINVYEKIKIEVNDPYYFECYRGRSELYKILGQDEKAYEDNFTYECCVMDYERKNLKV
ncbi:hypothetical protein PDL71_01930 [Lacibacter sp. MH-610]|uniref:hypothetical protein n=1 Tax=Lacibacter sp. MH-610 TaxID=3020883 RepID=UPI003892375F